MTKADVRIATIIAIGLFAYVVARAILVPITYDEAATFFHYINLERFWPGTSHWDANNHILNSALTLVSFKLFGSSEVALRLPNVLSAILYLVFALKFSQNVKHRLLAWLLFLSLVCNQFILAFLGLSRGYGLSLALLIAALYIAYSWMKNKQLSHLTFTFVMLQLATLSNLSLLLLNITFSGLIVLWFLVRFRQKWLKYSLVFIANFAAIGWFIWLSFEYKQRNLLYYGSGDGFWNVTLLSVAKYGFTAIEQIFPYLTIALVVITLVLALVSIAKLHLDRVLLFPLLLFACVAGTWLMNALLDVNYPEDRVAIFYLVLLPVTLVFLSDKLLNQAEKNATKTGLIAAALPLLLVPVNFALSANFSHVYLWKEDACAKVFYNEILAQANQGKLNPTIDGYRTRDLPFNYYNYRNGGVLNPIQDVAFRGSEPDFHYANLDEPGEWKKYEVVLTNQPSGLTLLKHKNLRKRILIDRRLTEPVETSNQPYFVWYETDVDTLGGRDLLWQIQVEMPVLNAPFVGWIESVFTDAKNNTLAHETIHLDWLKPTWEAGVHLNKSIMMANVPEETTHIKLFFWNVEEKPVSFGNVKAELFELIEPEVQGK